MLKLRRARKEHICNKCEKKIDKWEYYCQSHSKDKYLRYHPICVELAQPSFYVNGTDCEELILRDGLGISFNIKGNITRVFTINKLVRKANHLFGFFGDTLIFKVWLKTDLRDENLDDTLIALDMRHYEIVED